MLVTNIDTIPGEEIAEVLGIVKGNTVRAKWFGKDILASIRNIVGGELKEYTEMLTESREQAVSRMVHDAEAVGADAIINVRFVTSQISQGASELLAYGTAVKLKERK
ncbi:MAG: YbjQ family protein [Candidatus Hydrothermarchaeales archaeon]